MYLLHGCLVSSHPWSTSGPRLPQRLLGISKLFQDRFYVFSWSSSRAGAHHVLEQVTESSDVVTES